MVFVTGATGLVGSHLLYRLLESGHEVCALRRRQSRLEEVFKVFGQYPDGESLWKRLEWVEGDVLDADSVSAFVAASTVVYHCAAVVSFDSGEHGALLETNLKGTENIASLCLQHRKRLCYVSSIAALGDAQNEGDVIDEDTPVIPGRDHSVYSQSKGMAEKVVWRYIDKGLEAVIVCPSVILGAGMWTRSSARLYRTAARGIPFYTNGCTGYVDVRDVVSLMVRLADDRSVSSRRFILNGGNHTVRELFTVAARVNGRRPPFLHLTPFLAGVLWRLLAFVGWITRTRPAFTRETARTGQHVSRYSNARILALYPGYRFYTLEQTMLHIHNQALREG